MIERQFNWRCWQWPWHRKLWDADYQCHAHFAGVGPFQFHWWGK